MGPFGSDSTSQSFDQRVSSTDQSQALGQKNQVAQSGGLLLGNNGIVTAGGTTLSHVNTVAAQGSQVTYNFGDGGAAAESVATAALSGFNQLAQQSNAAITSAGAQLIASLQSNSPGSDANAATNPTVTTDLSPISSTATTASWYSNLDWTDWHVWMAIAIGGLLLWALFSHKKT